MTAIDLNLSFLGLKLEEKMFNNYVNQLFDTRLLSVDKYETNN